MLCTTLGTCQVPGALGASCSSTKPCGYSLNCSAAGTCTAALGTVGATCSSTGGIECDFAGKELYCEPTTSACVQLTSSDTCSVALTYCVAGATCDQSNGDCIPGPGDSDACDPANNQYCQFPALCVDGLCQLPTDVPLCAP
jgi:hypothetical protein